MISQANHHDEQTAVGQIRPDLPCCVANDAEFRAAVRAGIASFEVGPTYDLATVEAELRGIIHGQG
jgi:hypothetical protein